MDEGPRVNASLTMICCSCHLVDLLFVNASLTMISCFCHLVDLWFELLMSVHFFVALSQLRLIIWKKPELNPTLSSLKTNFATPDKKTTVILWQLL